jgi:hypothetical protein
MKMSESSRSVLFLGICLFLGAIINKVLFSPKMEIKESNAYKKEFDSKQSSSLQIKSSDCAKIDTILVPKDKNTNTAQHDTIWVYNFYQK